MSTEEEKAYMAKSLKFINSYKNYFTPVLSNIASKMNDNSNKNLIEAMTTIINTRNPKLKDNSNLKELIVKLSEKKLIKGEYILTDHEGDIAKYVEQCLRIIGIKRSKKIIYELFYHLMQDLKENEDLRAKVNSFKENNNEWKKMVGMLIPPGAHVKIRVDLVETSSRPLFGNEWRTLTSRKVIGTVVQRGTLDSVLRKDFKKVVRLPEEIIRKANVNKEVRLDPEDIELYDSQPETGEASVEGKASESQQPEAGEVASVERRDDINRSRGFSTGPINQQSVEEVSPGQVKPEIIGGGQQRTTRKHKNSIIGSARKTRTYR